MDDNGALYDAFFAATATDGRPYFNDDVQKVASVVHRSACEKIKSLQNGAFKGIDIKNFKKDAIEISDEKIRSFLLKCEVVMKHFQNSKEAKDDFQKNFDSSSGRFEEIVSGLREIAQELTDHKCDSQKLIGLLNTVAVLSGLLTLVCPPAGIAGCAVANVAAASVTAKANSFASGKVKDAKELNDEANNYLSSMRYISCSGELTRELDSFVSSDVLKQMAGRVEALSTDVTSKKDMTKDEFANRFEEVLDHCLGQMAQDSKLIDEYGKELAPIVMTFIFVVCLMNDHNRIVLECSWSTLHFVSSLGYVGNAAAMAFQAGAFLVGGAVPFCVPLQVAVNSALAVLNFLDAKNPPKSATNIRKAADEIERIFKCLKEVYNKTKEYRSHREVAEWARIMVLKAPVGTESADLEMAVQDYLPEVSKKRIRTFMTGTDTNNWIVAVPAIHAERLKKQKDLRVKGKLCEICP